MYDYVRKSWPVLNPSQKNFYETKQVPGRVQPKTVLLFLTKSKVPYKRHIAWLKRFQRSSKWMNFDRNQECCHLCPPPALRCACCRGELPAPVSPLGPALQSNFFLYFVTTKSKCGNLGQRYRTSRNTHARRTRHRSSNIIISGHEGSHVIDGVDPSSGR